MNADDEFLAPWRPDPAERATTATAGVQEPSDRRRRWLMLVIPILVFAVVFGVLALVDDGADRSASSVERRSGIPSLGEVPSSGRPGASAGGSSTAAGEASRKTRASAGTDVSDPGRAGSGVGDSPGSGEGSNPGTGGPADPGGGGGTDPGGGGDGGTPAPSIQLFAGSMSGECALVGAPTLSFSWATQGTTHVAIDSAGGFVVLLSGSLTGLAPSGSTNVGGLCLLGVVDRPAFRLSAYGTNGQVLTQTITL